MLKMQPQYSEHKLHPHPSNRNGLLRVGIPLRVLLLRVVTCCPGALPIQVACELTLHVCKLHHRTNKILQAYTPPILTITDDNIKS